MVIGYKIDYVPNFHCQISMIRLRSIKLFSKYLSQSLNRARKKCIANLSVRLSIYLLVCLSVCKFVCVRTLYRNRNGFKSTNSDIRWFMREREVQKEREINVVFLVTMQYYNYKYPSVCPSNLFTGKCNFLGSLLIQIFFCADSPNL